jgi:hypothetical protein
LKYICYTPSAGKVKNAIPGVFFYFTDIVAPSANFTIDVVQFNDGLLNKLFAVQQGKDIKLFDASCNKFATVKVSEPTTGQAKMIVSGATPGAKYVLSVKYDSKSLIGASFTGTAPTSEYTFVTNINGVPVPASDGKVTAVPGCKDNTPLPLYCSMGGLKDQDLTVTDLGANSLKVFPNPFVNTVTIQFASAEDAHVIFEIHNVLGQKIATLMDGKVEGGVLNVIEYQPVNLTPGVLFYRLIINDEVQTGKVIYNGYR